MFFTDRLLSVTDESVLISNSILPRFGICFYQQVILVQSSVSVNRIIISSTPSSAINRFKQSYYVIFYYGLVHVFTNCYFLVQSSGNVY